MTTTPRGAFIVLEGLDRSGKTTQVRLLAQKLTQAGHVAKTLSFPDRTTAIGHLIDEYLRSATTHEDHVIHQLFNANRWEAADMIREVLASGTTIVCDRYYYSGIVYSVAKQNPALSPSWARASERGLPRPDMVLFLDLDEDAARARGGWGDEVYEKAEMQKKVRELFWALSRGGRDARGRNVLGGGTEGCRWTEEEEDLVVVDAGGSVDEVACQIWTEAEKRVDQVRRGELGKEVRTVT